jgi:two-component system response regulator HydG
MNTLHGNGPVAAHASQKDASLSPEAGSLAALLEILPVGIFTLDPEQRIRSMNPAAAALLGADPLDAVGRICSEVLHCRFRAPECAACTAREDGHVHRGFPTEVRRADGTTRSLLVDAVPIAPGEVAVVLRDVTESERLRRAIHERWVFHGLVCVSAIMKEIVGQIREVAPFDSTVLVLGESGTGKEVVARALHAESPRASKPFVAVNCSAYSENLLESELFGHVRGAFTGADRDRRGRFEIASGGTVFLDEIGEISPKMQVKLLRVIQEREIERVGESRPRTVDIRVVAATNRDLYREVRDGRFREDLFYRLNVVTLRLPPLRERKEDIPALADHLMERVAARTGKPVRGISEGALAVLLQHAWPGNVRELENVIESAVVRARGDVITSADLPAAFHAPGAPAAPPQERLREALRRTAGCVTRAARLLGIHRTTLWRQMRELGIRREEFLNG